MMTPRTRRGRASQPLKRVRKRAAAVNEAIFQFLNNWPSPGESEREDTRRTGSERAVSAASTRGNICLRTVPPFAFVWRFVRALVPDFIGSVLIIRALHAYLLIWSRVSSYTTYAHLYTALSPFSLLLLSAARILYVRAAYIIRSIRYLMAVSVSDV